MDQIVSAAEANRTFSRLLRGVRTGQSFVVTSHGRPIAQLIPATAPAVEARAARNALLERLAREPVGSVEPWTREELYEDES